MNGNVVEGINIPHDCRFIRTYSTYSLLSKWPRIEVLWDNKNNEPMLTIIDDIVMTTDNYVLIIKKRTLKVYEMPHNSSKSTLRVSYTLDKLGNNYSYFLTPSGQIMAYDAS